MLDTLRSVVSFFVARAARFKMRAHESFRNGAEHVSNFIFTSSKRTDIIMLLFNAVAILSSHTAQIHGLEKSNRENKEFLIEQEEKERKIDLALTLIPPLILNYFLAKKLERGEITTQRAKKLLTGRVAEDAGAPRGDIYSKITHKETVLRTGADIIDFFKKNLENFPDTRDSIENFVIAMKKFIRKEFPQVYKDVGKTLREYSRYLDKHSPNRLQNSIWKVAKHWEEMELDGAFPRTNETRDLLRNGSAIDELCGLNNGILIASSVGYSILASNVIMPYFKNKWTNEEYDRGLKLSGETRESMRRKRRFEYNENPVTRKNDRLFKPFSNLENAAVYKDGKAPTFDKFIFYSDLSYRNSGLKI